MSDIIPIEVATARRLTERIRLMAMTVGDNIEKLKGLVAEAKATDVHTALGYASWTAYLADVLGETPLMLERDVRRELVAELTEHGMSTRAIAPIVGASIGTVNADQQVFRTEHVEAPADVPDLPVNPRTGEVYEAGDAVHGSPEATVTVTETHSVKTVTGLDGKEYKTAPKEPRRTSIIEDARKAGWELRKASERLERLKGDDRFTKNKAEILAALQPHLDFANEVISDL